MGELSDLVAITERIRTLLLTYCASESDEETRKCLTRISRMSNEGIIEILRTKLGNDNPHIFDKYGEFLALHTKELAKELKRKRKRFYSD